MGDNYCELVQTAHKNVKQEREAKHSINHRRFHFICIGDHVSLCAMCSHNEAAIRWNRSMEDIYWRNFILSYTCTPPPTSSGDDVSSEVTNCMHVCTIHRCYDDYHMQDPELSSDNKCWYNNEQLPFDDNLYSGVSSIGIELQHGTKCNFKLNYRADGKNYKKTAECTGEG